MTKIGRLEQSRFPLSQVDLLDAVLQSIPTGVVVLDRDLRYLALNQKAAALNGLPIESHLGRLACDVVPAVFPVVAPILRRVFESGQPIEDVELKGETPARPREQRWWATSYFPIFDEGGVVAVAALFSDITEQKQVAEERAESERRYRTLAEVMPANVGLVGIDGRVIFANRHWLEYSDLDAEQARSWKIYRLLHPDDRALALQQWGESMRTGEQFSAELRLQRRDGAYRWHLCRVLPIRSEAGTLISWLAASVDIDDQKRVEETLRERERQLRDALDAKNEFLGLVSHELRTPTTTIYGGARILRTRQVSEADRESVLSDIETEAYHLHRMIEDLLTLARLEDATDVKTEPLLLQRQIPAIVGRFKSRHPKRQIAVECPDDLPEVAAEATYLERTLENLLSNADKYSPEGSLVQVKAGRSEDRAVVSVLDRGPGVSQEDLVSIFDRFYRSMQSPRGARGLGLGLTLCKRLVTAQSGLIWAELRPGGGLIVSFTLPVYRDDLLAD